MKKLLEMIARWLFGDWTEPPEAFEEVTGEVQACACCCEHVAELRPADGIGLVCLTCWKRAKLEEGTR